MTGLGRRRRIADFTHLNDEPGKKGRIVTELKKFGNIEEEGEDVLQGQIQILPVEVVHNLKEAIQVDKVFHSRPPGNPTGEPDKNVGPSNGLPSLKIDLPDVSPGFGEMSRKFRMSLRIGVHLLQDLGLRHIGLLVEPGLMDEKFEGMLNIDGLGFDEIQVLLLLAQLPGHLRIGPNHIGGIGEFGVARGDADDLPKCGATDDF